MGCETPTQSTETDWILQGAFSPDDEVYMPLCQILRFKKQEEFGCGKCSKATEHEFSTRLLNAPPILVIHCKPLTSGGFNENGIYETWVDGKVTRLEHSMAFSTYSDESLDPKTISWAFYRLYGVVLRRGTGGDDGHYVCAFEQRQTGRWLFFDDEGTPKTRQLTRRALDRKVKKMIHGEKSCWSVFMLMYQKLFQVPVRLLARITSSSSAIALQDQQSQEESVQLEIEEAGEPEMEEAGQPKTEEAGEAGSGDAQEEYFTPGESVGDEGLLGFESDSGQARDETQGAAGDEQLQGDPNDSKIRHVQAEQSMPTEQPAVEADPESSTSKPNGMQGAADDKLQSNPSDLETPCVQEQSLPAEQPAVEADPESSTPKPATEQTRGETQGAADNVSQRDASDSEIPNGQAEQPLPADLPTEQGIEVEPDPESSTAEPVTTKTGSRAQAEKSAQNESQDEDENEQMTGSEPASEIVRTEVAPSAQPKKKQAKESAKRPRDKALDEDEKTSTSVPASKKPRTGAKSSTQPKKKETKPKATKDASDDHEDEKAEKSAPPTKKAKTVVEPSAGYGGRETRARAAAKRKNDQIPDVDKNQDEPAKPASKKARTTKAPVQPGKTQPKSKRKK